MSYLQDIHITFRDYHLGEIRMFGMTKYTLLSATAIALISSSTVHAMGVEPITKIPESIETSDIASTTNPDTQHTFSQDGVHVTVSHVVPENIAPALTIYSPEQHTKTLSNKILIKGVNRYLTDIFINNSKVSLRQDGRFFYDASLPKIGENIIWLSLISPNFDVTIIPLRVTKLRSVDGNLGKASIYSRMANSRYVDISTDISLATVITREAFAAAIFAYKKTLPAAHTKLSDSDNPKVAQVVDAGLMTAFPDGSFKPKQPVKMVDYLVGIVRLLNLDIQKYESVALPYTNLSKSHWTTPYAQALYAEGYLASSNTLLLSETLTFKTFSDYFSRLPGVIAELENRIETEPTPLSEDAIRDAVSATVLQVNELRTAIAKSQKLEIKYPAEETILYQPTVTVEGRVFPIEEIKLNHTPVIPSADGSFKVRVELEKVGKHAIRVSSSFGTAVRLVTYTPGYSDMAGHWAGNTAAQFAQLGWRFDYEPTFSPHKTVTRLELTLLLNRIFSPPASTENMTILDIPEDKQERVRSAVSQGWLSLRNGRFFGNAAASKAEVAVVLRRVLDLPKTDTPESHFVDVTKTHWAAADIDALVSASLLSPGGYFSPSRAISRAELVALLAKVPTIKAKAESIQL
jgi:hypothetical protein